MKVVSIGAEARLFESSYLGEKVLVKERLSKGYRNQELDEKLRRLRTQREASLLYRAKTFGVNAPRVLHIDKQKSQLFLELIEGKKLKDVLSGKNLHYCEEFGKMIGKLHAHHVVHGDLTTSNVLVRDKELVLIDFGLGFDSKKLEDKAMDLLVLKKTFMATHFRLENGWKKILKGYISETKNKAIEKAIERIEKRARYH